MVGKAGLPGQGPFMFITVRLRDGLIAESNFATYGCPASQACGRFASAWLIGKSLAEAVGLREEDILAAA